MRHLSQQLVSSQEQERKALSRELHDEIGQLLTALRMELGNLERAQSDAGMENDPHLDQAKKLAESTLAVDPRYRDGAAAGDAGHFGFRPGARMAGARVFAALQHAHSARSGRRFTRRAGSAPHVFVSDRAGRADQLRASRQAKNIHVRLEDTSGNLAVVVEDDGVGFDQDGGVAYGLGLLGITERVRELCGEVSINSTPGKGTRIAVVLPFARENVAGGDGELVKTLPSGVARQAGSARCHRMMAMLALQRVGDLPLIVIQALDEFRISFIGEMIFSGTRWFSGIKVFVGKLETVVSQRSRAVPYSGGWCRRDWRGTSSRRRAAGL